MMHDPPPDFDKPAPIAWSLWLFLALVIGYTVLGLCLNT